LLPQKIWRVNWGGGGCAKRGKYVKQIREKKKRKGGESLHKGNHSSSSVGISEKLWGKTQTSRGDKFTAVFNYE